MSRTTVNMPKRDTSRDRAASVASESEPCAYQAFIRCSIEEVSAGVLLTMGGSVCASMIKCIIA